MPNDREIERKFLLRALPALPPGATSDEIDQGYLPGDKIHERIRRMRGPDGIRYFRTVKIGKGVDRQEFEEQTSERFFAAVWPLTEEHRVRKRRHRVTVGSDAWEIDEFLDRELVLAELELDAVDQHIDIPDFIRDQLVRDVSDEEAFTNFKLAR